MNPEYLIEAKESVVEIKKNRLKRFILKELHLNGSQSLADLSRLYHTSVPSMTVLISDLIRENWVIELGVGASKSGRKPALYGLAPTDRYVLVWDLDKYTARAVLFNLEHKVVSQASHGLPLANNLFYAPFLIDQTRAMLHQNGIEQSQLVGIGVSMPGLIDATTEFNYTYPTAENESLNTLIRAALDTPCFIVNDAKAAALGEKRFGLAKEVNHVLAVNIDWGIGMGILINGEIFQGSAGFSGELGHAKVRPDGDLCTCGKTGCLETVASAAVLIARAKKEIEAGRATKLWHFCNGDANAIDGDMVIQAAHSGDELCIDLLCEVGLELGKALSTAVHLFNPQMIIINGLLAKAERYITIPIEQAIQKYCLVELRNKLTVQTSQLGNAARQYGTYSYLLERVIDSVG